MDEEKEQKKLTRKQERWIEEYMIDLNATQAAIRAGYSEHTAKQIGTENLSKPVLQEAIAAKMAERSKKAELTAEWVISRLMSVADRSMQIEQVLDNEGRPVGQYKFNANGANKSLEVLGKRLGLWVDRIDGKIALNAEEWLEKLK